jgi:hypothetical protein
MWQYLTERYTVVTTYAIDIACENAVVLTGPACGSPVLLLVYPRSPTYGKPISGVGKVPDLPYSSTRKELRDSLAQHFENEGWCSGNYPFFKLVMHFLVNISHVHILLSLLRSNVKKIPKSKSQLTA